MPTLKDFQSMAELMKHLKPLLDGIVDGNITPDEFLLKECEKFDLDVNEGREFIEKWSPKSSRFLAVSMIYFNLFFSRVIKSARKERECRENFQS